MAKVDIETYLEELKLLFQDKLTAKLLAIDTEKNDGTICETVENSAYFLQGYHEAMTNYNRFIIYGIDSIVSNSVNGANAKKLTLFLELAITDRGMNNENIKKMLRYGRALEEIVNENFDRILGHTRFAVELLEPATFADESGGVYLKSVGVKISANLA